MGFFARTHTFLVRYERHLSVAAMVIGFVIDYEALRRADLLPETLLLYFYIAGSGIAILLIHLIEEGVWKGERAAQARPWLPLVVQFFFGSWFSAFLVFYSRSASLAASWPFLLVLFLIFAGTEVFKKYGDRLVFQNAIFFFGLFSFSVYAVPLALGGIGFFSFLLSGAVAALAFSVFFALLFVTGPRRFTVNARRVLTAALFVYVFVNVLYFAHLLPPLPLALKDIGVYHTLTRTTAGYEVTGEKEPWFADLFGAHTVHIRSDERVYAFSSVFTPVAIQTDLLHRWERYDASEREWTLRGVVRFPVSGGREEGYRGFSYVSGIAEGKWRVSVETADRRLIGRIVFTVEYTSTPLPLVGRIL